MACRGDPTSLIYVHPCTHRGLWPGHTLLRKGQSVGRKEKITGWERKRNRKMVLDVTIQVHFFLSKSSAIRGGKR